MPRISASSAKPRYTTLQVFQQAIGANEMIIPSYQTDLGHVRLERNPLDFRSSKKIGFVVPVNLGDALTQPPRITSRASDIALAAEPQATA